MAQMRFNLNQQFRQNMRLSAKMIQSINLIAMPIEELREHIYEEAEKNPALEILRDSHREAPFVRTSARSGSAAESDAWQAFLESTGAAEESLQEHLLAQLALLPLSEDERRVGEHIIQNLDDRGHNSVPPENLLSAADPLSLLAKMLKIVRSLDPPGTACTDVRESLAVQAEQKKDAPPLALLILKLHFDVLEKKRSALICKALNARNVACTPGEVEGALEFIKTLDPFPARRFMPAGGGIQFAVPEIYIRRATEEEREEQGSAFIIEFTNDGLPQIAVSPVYEKLALQNTDSRSKRFAAAAVREANGFMHMLELRTKSIYAAIAAIVAHQYDFFDKGPGNVRALRMKDIAEEIGVHETTVSRIANGKYIQCEWGIYEIKYFFSSAVTHTHVKNTLPFSAQHKQGAAGLPPEMPAVPDSKEAVKHRLREIIETHEKNGGKKLSDAKLAGILAGEGISVARRTVAKYRSELNIHSSFDRS